MMSKLRLVDVLVTVVIAVIFGVIYKLWSPVYYFVKPFGLHLDQLIYGMWFIAATVAFLLIRKPGVAVLAEMAAASGEFLTGSEWGLQTLFYGLMQGLFAEAVFFLFRYRRADLRAASLAALASGVASLMLDAAYGYIGALATWNLTLYVGARLVGTVLIAGWGAVLFVRALAAILMVTHDRRIVQDYATREWVIEAGRLVRDLPAPRLCEAAGGPSQRRYAR